MNPGMQQKSLLRQLSGILLLVASAAYAQTPTTTVSLASNAPVASAQTDRGATLAAKTDKLDVSLCVNRCSSDEKPEEGGCFAALLKSVAWPITALLISWLVIRNAHRIRYALGPLRRIKAGGFEFEFNPDDAMRAKASITESYEEFQKTARTAYAHYARVYSIQEHFDQALRAFREHFESATPSSEGRHWPGDFRATLHIWDIVIGEWTYQLLDYSPQGGGSGRRFSARRGILGRTLRLGRSLGMGDALKRLPGAAGSEIGDTDETRLVEEWGMFRKEASAWRQDKRHSFLCVIVRAPAEKANNGIPLGVLYIDSKVKDAFGDDEAATAMAKWAETSTGVKTLGEGLSKAIAELREGGTFLEF
jgi:hypothetical protein